MSNREPRLKFYTAFSEAEKRIDVFFYTSNVTKYLQAQIVFKRAGHFALKYYRTKTEPYEEDYSLGREGLLERSVKQVADALGRGRIFFVEDTSIRIEALSDREEFPGLSAKEWFQGTTFAVLDSALKNRGNNRRALVRSDIAMHVPGLKRIVHVAAITEGRVADLPAPSMTHPQYQWLTSTTFNGWFIPHGGARTLAEMEFEESLGFDFRVRAFRALLDRLEEYTFALNLPSSAYSRVSSDSTPGQLSMLSHDTQVYLIIGRTCAGKSTLCDYLAKQSDITTYEASTILRTIAVESGLQHGGDAFVQAQIVLKERGPDVVARKVLELIQLSGSRRVFISGFRTPQEIEAVLLEHSSAKLVFIDASERTRFERFLMRPRDDRVYTFQDFLDADRAQWSFGLLGIAELLADVIVTNEGTIPEYFALIDQIATSGIKLDRAGELGKKIERSQLVRCLRILDNEGRPLECKEIEAITNKEGDPIRYNNANKVLKPYPELATRFEGGEDLVRYAITDAGRTVLRIIGLKDRELAP